MTLRPYDFHIPVLLTEVIHYLRPQPNQNFIDCTLGGGGHAAALLEKIFPNGRLLGIDADPQAVENARQRLAPAQDRARRIILIQDNFRNLNKIVHEADFFPIHGILLDLGLSSAQLADEERGFSFKTAGPLDMRWSPTQPLTAADIVNKWPEKELTRIFKEYGEERFSQKIASQIVKQRQMEKIQTTDKLVGIVLSAIPARYYPKKIHPATKVFQALRIAVNDELESLRLVLPQASNLLALGAILAVISFHSLEDRIVKNFFKAESRGCVCPKEFPICNCGHKPRLKIITKKAIKPSEDEVRRNPRARSARLRVAEKVL
ncbi:MAG: 16S rRNA (cytosine(1402)-N(4))-methyltransferase RsmH [Candidatus Doudnabacteria bacterium]|nr:16S rRNA (cytosine(1402)-N(4))-methyltransferase RsmH [Candidatus Doudnabacteria bacterium]